ncbi:MAG: hypothetical protein FJ276_33835, partial [Planctomycetes bacterium]|nr:hypothetical protein [Planctomycetota bacterium]
VYHDRNNNGLRESGEEPIEGVRVVLTNAQGTQLAVTHTDSGGRYEFAGLSAGSVSITQSQPAGWLDGLDSPGRVDGHVVGSATGNDRLEDIRLLWGSEGVEYNFGELLAGSVQGRVHADLDGDCTFDPNEIALAGVKIELLSATGVVLATTFTNQEGAYRFADLIPGTYAVRETQPAGYFHRGQKAGSHGGNATVADLISHIPVGSGQQLTDYDFCEEPPSSIAGIVFADPNRNGVFDAGDALLPGITVQLLGVSGQVLATATTDAGGAYRFGDLRAGVYSVRETQPTSYFHGGQHAGSQGGDDSVRDVISAVDIGAGRHLVDYNFSELPPASISGYVFQDGAPILSLTGRPPGNLPAIRDGSRTPDDTPIAGVTLELRHGLTGEVIAADQALPGAYPDGPITAVTDANGYYQFHSLPANTYAVYQVHPQKYLDGLDTAGTTNGVPINVNSEGLEFIVSRLAKDPENDAIIMIPVMVGQASRENNFSEVLLQSPSVPPILPPGPPPVFPTVVLASPSAVPWLPGPFGMPKAAAPVPIWGAGSLVTLTWHLSVINGGTPRGADSAAQTVVGSWRTISCLNHTQWMAVTMNGGTWTLPPEMADRYGDAEDAIMFGLPGAVPISGDFDGDGRSELGLYYAGQWFLDLNGNGRWDEDDLWASLGTEDDLPVVGDWDGDGKDDIGIFGPEWAGDERAIRVEPGLPDRQNVAGQSVNTRVHAPKNLPPEPSEATDGHRVLKRTAQGDPRLDLIDHVFRFGL